MPNKVDRTGQTWGRLTVLREHGRSKGGSVAWLCRCVCGNETVVTGANLANGNCKSCGCFKRDTAAALKPKLDMTGQRWGRLVVLKEDIRSPNGGIRWLCLCDCGKQKVIDGGNIRTGATATCGCGHHDRTVTHGMTKSREYAAWQSMTSRCNNPNHASYVNYGGRGITVCERWLDPSNFLADMGKRPSREYSLDRIDNDGGYEPGNCRWATRAEQTTNRRMPRNSKSGVKGVRWAPDQQKWVAFITLGSFDNKDDAIRCRQDAEQTLGRRDAANLSMQTGAAA